MRWAYQENQRSEGGEGFEFVFFLLVGTAMGAECNQCIQSALHLADQMLALANEGDAIRTDVGCGVFFGVLRDCAYKIRMLAESEMKTHTING